MYKCTCCDEIFEISQELNGEKVCPYCGGFPLISLREEE